VTSVLVLVLFQNSEPFQIKVNSLDYTIDTVLSQQSATDSKWCLVAFYSKSLSLVEQNYKIYNKEILTIIQALEEWRHFLKGYKGDWSGVGSRKILR